MNNEQDGFEAFKRASGGRAPRATIDGRGNLLLSKTAVALLGQPTRLHYFFDRQTKTVALRRTTEDNPDGYPLRQHPAGSSFMAAFRAFCTFYKIPFGPKARSFTPRLENGALVFEVGQEEKK